jgi:hypothetical protein
MCSFSMRRPLFLPGRRPTVSLMMSALGNSAGTTGSIWWHRLTTVSILIELPYQSAPDNVSTLLQGDIGVVVARLTNAAQDDRAVAPWDDIAVVVPAPYRDVVDASLWVPHENLLATGGQ